MRNHIEDHVRVFHPDCGGIFVGPLVPGAEFHCTECGLQVAAPAVLSIVEELLEPELTAALRRQVAPEDSKTSR